MRGLLSARVLVSAGAVALAPAAARAQAPAPAANLAAPAEPAPVDAQQQGLDAENDSEGYTPPEGGAAEGPLRINGYVDVGLFKAQGNGTSRPPGDTRFPADYGVDTFAPAVNSRGEVASTDFGDTFVNGFLPRSVGARGRATALLNTLNVDLRYQASASPLMVFSRVQLLPRAGAGVDGDPTRVVVEQAFGRLMPFDSQELSLSVGKFDSVFGIEYLDNQANIRTGVTPSLAARYTTGQAVGAKLFYRLQIAPLQSALSLNLAATNGGTMVESLQPADLSLVGAPVVSGRLGYELNLAVVQVKLGGSGSYGPRNDQQDPKALQKMWGADARVYCFGLALTGEYVHVDQDEGIGPKVTALGEFPLASAFHARAFWAQASFTLAADLGPLRRLTPYARYERRRAWFEGFDRLTVDRITAGLRVDLWDGVVLKGEYLRNGEREGAPTVRNDVYTSSLVYSW